MITAFLVAGCILGYIVLGTLAGALSHQYVDDDELLTILVFLLWPAIAVVVLCGGFGYLGLRGCKRIALSLPPASDFRKRRKSLY